MNNSDLYLYAVLAGNQGEGTNLHRERLSIVQFLSRGNLCAAFCFVPGPTAAPNRRLYSRVMRRLLRHPAVLPAPRRTILPSQEALLELLACQQTRMVEQLRRFAGLIEIRLRVVRKGGAAGRIVHAGLADGEAALLAEERGYLHARFCSALRSGWFTAKPLPLRHAHELLRLGCLLPQSSLPLFTLTCEALKSRLGPEDDLIVSRPLAPVDFVDGRLFH